MWEILTKDPKALALAIVAHLVLLGVLIFSLDWTPKLDLGGKPKPEAIKAVAVDDTKVKAEMERLDAIEKQKETEAEERLKKIEEQTRQAEAARKKEQQRLADIKKKEQAEKKRLAEIKRKQAAEETRLAEENKKKEALERKKREEEKRKAEAEKKRKAAAEAKRKAEEKKKRIAAEKALQEQLAAERAQLDAARERANQSVVAEYTSAIKQKVQRNWIKPQSAGSGLSCEVQVTLIPGGDVASVRVVRSSGDAVFDRSVEQAVRRAAPLPLPPDTALFNRFRDLQFRFNPT